MITKEKILIKTIPSPLGGLRVHQDIITREDGVEVSRLSNHTHVVSPDDDLSGELPEVQAKALEVRTASALVEWEAHKAKIQASIPIPTALDIWKQDMSATDSSMPRWFEDYITENAVTLAPGKAKDSYDAKVALRAGRPMSTTKVSAAMQDLTDDYAFSGTVTGAGKLFRL
jgi:hypothetical protein